MSYDPVRVLLVEDNPGDTRLICEMLAEARGAQIEVECIDRLSPGLKRLAAGGIDVLLLDLSLPDGQGLDVCVRAHTQAPYVPIVVLTGLDDETMAAKTLRIGAQDYLVKGQVDSQLLFRSMRYATERKRAEETLWESEKRYRLLAENAADPIWTVDMNMRLTYMSPSITKLLGYSVEETMAKPMEAIYTPTSFETAMKVLAEELAIENMEQKDLSRSRTVELELYRKDGSIVPVEGKFTFIREPDGQAVEILAIVRDITERKRAEEALKESEEKI